MMILRIVFDILVFFLVFYIIVIVFYETIVEGIFGSFRRTKLGRKLTKKRKKGKHERRR